MAPGRSDEGRKFFFFEKKKQNTFAHGGRYCIGCVGAHGGTMSKSFLVLFFNKELLPLALS
jgi:hypothetical protein